METNIDFLINFMKKYTVSKSSGELGEQDSAGASSSGSGGKNNVTTWSKTVGASLKRGKANPIGNTKWESGLTRGASNQLT